MIIQYLLGLGLLIGTFTLEGMSWIRKKEVSKSVVHTVANEQKQAQEDKVRQEVKSFAHIMASFHDISVKGEESVNKKKQSLAKIVYEYLGTMGCIEVPQSTLKPLNILPEQALAKNFFNFATFALDHSGNLMAAYQVPEKYEGWSKPFNFAVVQRYGVDTQQWSQLHQDKSQPIDFGKPTCLLPFSVGGKCGFVLSFKDSSFQIHWLQPNDHSAITWNTPKEISNPEGSAMLSWAPPIIPNTPQKIWNPEVKNMIFLTPDRLVAGYKSGAIVWYDISDRKKVTATIINAGNEGAGPVELIGIHDGFVAAHYDGQLQRWHTNKADKQLNPGAVCKFSNALFLAGATTDKGLACLIETQEDKDYLREIIFLDENLQLLSKEKVEILHAQVVRHEDGRVSVFGSSFHSYCQEQARDMNVAVYCKGDKNFIDYGLGTIIGSSNPLIDFGIVYTQGVSENNEADKNLAARLFYKTLPCIKQLCDAYMKTCQKITSSEGD